MTTEELESQSSELRSVLSLVRQRLRQEFMDDSEVMPKIDHALSGECGRDFVPQEELERMTKERDEWWQNCEKLAQEHNAKAAELERVQARCSEMREALLYANQALAECVVFKDDMFSDSRKRCSRALSSDAGRGWASPEDVKVLSQDKDRLDWLESVMTPAENYVEVYLAGLRIGGAPATEFQFETNPHFPKWSLTNGKTLREAIDAAKQALANAKEKGLIQ